MFAFHFAFNLLRASKLFRAFACVFFPTKPFFIGFLAARINFPDTWKMTTQFEITLKIQRTWKCQNTLKQTCAESFKVLHLFNSLFASFYSSSVTQNAMLLFRMDGMRCDVCNEWINNRGLSIIRKVVKISESKPLENSTFHEIIFRSKRSICSPFSKKVESQISENPNQSLI